MGAGRSAHLEACRAALHVDTGLNRLGMPEERGRALSAPSCSSAFEVSLVMSHLACADDPRATP